jgi:hypothetical protein
MELTIERSEGKIGLIFKKNVYFLTMGIELTSEEYKLYKKHNWHNMTMTTKSSPTMYSTESYDGLSFGGVIAEPGKKKTLDKFTFTSVEGLLSFQNEVIANSKILKNNLQNVVGITSGGQIKVEL